MAGEIQGKTNIEFGEIFRGGALGFTAILISFIPAFLVGAVISFNEIKDGTLCFSPFFVVCFFVAAFKGVFSIASISTFAILNCLILLFIYKKSFPKVESGGRENKAWKVAFYLNVFLFALYLVVVASAIFVFNRYFPKFY